MMSEYRFLPLRGVRPGGDSEDRYDRWPAGLDEELSDPATDRNEFCRRVLGEICFPGPDAEAGASRGESLPPTTRILLDQPTPAT